MFVIAGEFVFALYVYIAVYRQRVPWIWVGVVESGQVISWAASSLLEAVSVWIVPTYVTALIATAPWSSLTVL